MEDVYRVYQRGVRYNVGLVDNAFGQSVGVAAAFTGGVVDAVGVIVVIVAALNLIIDFDFIEKGSEMMLPKDYEWYGAFGLMVTIVWLYIEILRLLAKLQRR